MNREKVDPLLTTPEPVHVKAQVVQAQVVQAQVVQAQVVVQPGQQFVVVGQQGAPQAQNTLIPYPEETNWHDSECDRCCTCQGDCCLAWFCGCFSLGHIASKLEALGEPYCLKFWHIVIFAIILSIVDMILTSITQSQTRLSGIFLFVVTFQLRRRITTKLNFPGSCCGDCLWSFFCAPCVITQMNGTLWSQPEVQPGCSCDDNFAQVV
mmetsp:Transcript_14369/g.17085  ORF Transcript_14369/g.17085 Transcript_14369/m.17085 type:complete len:209 (+) Transcript_14369:96-722(+)